IAGLLSMAAPGRADAVDDEALGGLPLHDHDPSECQAQSAKHSHAVTERGDSASPCWANMKERLERAMRYGFVTLLDDLSFWLTVGLLFTGLLSAALPDDFFSAALGLDGGLLPMLVVMAAGVPLYLCASASTPIAAALVAKGLSPGAALVFLLVGPATNAATIAVVGRLLGRHQLRIYLGSIIGVSLVAGLVLDAVAGDLVRAATLGARGTEDPGLLAALKLFAAVGFAGLLVWSARRTRFHEGLREAREQGTRLRAAAGRLGWSDALRPSILGGGLVLLALIWLPGGLLVVEPGYRGVVQRFGRVVESDLAPGLHLHWPPPIGRGSAVDVARIRQVGISASARGRASYFVTADANLLDVRAVVHYRVNDPVRFAFGVEDAEGIVADLARGVFVRIVAATPIDGLYTTERVRTEQALRAALKERMGSLAVGVEVVDARLLDVHAPASVHEAFRDVASALEDRAREIHEANGDAVERVAAAQGESSELLEKARAEQHRMQQLAIGTTAPFRALAEVHRAESSTTEMRLYLETLERSLAKPHKYINGASGSGGELDLWIRSDDSGMPADALPPGLRRPPGRGMERRTP
ncbi:MAG: permease, partial [Proteobacteria bacterium]|nr:permease [Pseudomonadota bacterium]